MSEWWENDPIVSDAEAPSGASGDFWINDPVVPDSSAQPSPPAPQPQQGLGVGDYVRETGRKSAEVASGLVGSLLKGSALATTANPRAVAEIEDGIANVRSMPVEQAEAFRQSIKDRVKALDINPLAAVNYEAALRAVRRGDTNAANGYLKAAREYANPGRVKDQPAFKAGKAFAERVAKDLPKQDSRFAGSLFSDVVGGAASTAVLLPAGIGGPAGVAGLGALASGAEGYEAAMRDIEGSNRDENGNPINYRDDRGGLYNAGSGAEAENVARRAGQVSMAPGLSEAVPIEMLLDQTVGRIPFFKSKAGAGAWDKAKRSLYRIAAQAFTEGGQEGFQTWANNVINRIMVDPSQQDWESVGRNALVGSIVGGGMQSAVESYSAVRGDAPLPPPPGDAPPPRPPGAAPAAAGAAQAVQPVRNDLNDLKAAAPSEDALLAGAGWTPEQIADMSPAERAAAVEEAQAQGVEPFDPFAGAPEPGTAPRAPRASAGPAQAIPEEPTIAAPPSRLTPGPGIWANADSDLPITILDEPPQQDRQSGQWFQRVDDGNGGIGYVPVDEIRPAPRGTRTSKQPIQTPEDLEAVRPTVNAEPTPAQAQAGNYQKGHIRIHGMDVSIENPRGSIRRGVDPDGNEWQSPELPADYGYIKRTAGNDGDQVDVYIGSNPASDRVFVIDQMDLETGKFDEHKAVLGAGELGEAVDLYVNSFDNPTLDRIGDVTEMSVDEFRQWVKDGKATKRPAAKAGVGIVTPNMPTETGNPASQPVENIGATNPGISAQPVASERIPTDLPRAEVREAFSKFFATKKPLSPEAFAKFAQIDVPEAARALQYAAMQGSIIQGRNGKWRRPRTVTGPLDVLEFIASVGGIQDVTGELRGMDLPKMTRLGPVVRRSGLHPDKILDLLLQERYIFDPGWGTNLPRQTDVSSVYDVISRHMSGPKVYSQFDQAEADARETERRNEMMPEDWRSVHPVEARWGEDVWEAMNAYFDETDTDQYYWTSQELNDAAKLIYEGVEPDNAFESAIFRREVDLLDPEDTFPEVIEWMRRREQYAIEAFGDLSPFPDVETDTNATSQGTQEAGNRVPEPVTAGQESGTQGGVERPREEASGSRASVSEAGGQETGDGELGGQEPSGSEIGDMLLAEMRRTKRRLMDARRDGRNDKAAIIEQEMRRMRASVFEAENAAYRAIETGDPAEFFAYAFDFPSVDVYVKASIRRAEEAAPAGAENPDTDNVIAVAGQDGWLISSNENGVLDDDNPIRTVSEKSGSASFAINVIKAKPGKFVASYASELQGQSGSSSPATTEERWMFDTPEEAIADAASRMLRGFEYDFRDKNLPEPKRRDAKKIILKLKELGGKSEDQPASNLPAVTEDKTLYVQFGRRRFEMESYEQASKAVADLLNETGGTFSGETGPRVDTPLIVDASGKVVAHISQNGRVWPGKPGEWQSDMKPLYDPRADQPITEQGADNKPQLVIPGAEQDVRGAMQNAAKAPLKASAPQKGMDVGLFGSERDQTDMFDQPQVKAEQPKAGLLNRETWPNGKWKAVEGDRVYLRVAGPFGTPASVNGEVVRGKDGDLRVRISGSSNILGGRYSGRQSRPYDSSWTVDDDPFYSNQEAKQKAEQEAKDKAWRDEMSANTEKAVADAKAAVAAGDKPLTFENARIGLRVKGHHPVSGGDMIVGDIVEFEKRPTIFYYENGRLDEAPRSAGPNEWFTVPQPEQIVSIPKYDEDGNLIEPAAALDEAFDEVFGTKEPEQPKATDTWAEALDPLQQTNVTSPKTAGQAAASAVKNVGMSIEEAAKGLNALFGGKNKLSSGFTFDDGDYEKAKPFFRAAVAHLGEAAKDMKDLALALVRALSYAGLSREAAQNMRPYLLRFMTDVKDGKITVGEEPAAASQPEGKFHPIVNAFVDYLSQPDAAFDTITEARKFAADRGFKVQPGTPEAKHLDEMLELAIVLTARTLVAASKSRPVVTAYRRLVDLYRRQPNLGVRTSESMADQAYSTPAPLAYIASRLAGVASAKDVLEPTAGNGMLLIEASPSKATVNELNDRRADALKAQGFRVSQKDAATKNLRHKGYPVDSIIANPPFGAVKEADGSSKVFTFENWNTTQIDHVIALNALQNLKEDGRAVLIVGSVKEGNDKSRSDSYNTKQKREFYWRLYQGYNVTDHFTVAGDLYKRQGAGWPVDVIVIEGKGKSARPLPAVELPKIYDTWESLEEKLNEAPAQAQPGSRPPVGGNEVSGPSDVGNVGEDGGRLEAGSGGNRAPSQAGRPSGRNPATEPEGGVLGGRDQREPGNAGQQQSSEPDGGAVSPGTRTDGDGDRKPAAPARERLTQEAGAAQQPYQPMSGQKSLDTKIPTNMADAVQTSLEDLADRYGDLDAWLEKELGYKKGEIGNYLAAEQVDAVALAIDNVKKNAAFIIGDQTGIGKGRVVASALRYAMRQGLTPIFVTEKPNLYGDMIRDLNDIGVPEMLGRDVKPFLTNAGASIPLDDEAVAWFEEAEKAKVEGTPVPAKRGKFLRASGGDLHKRQMAALQAGGKDFDIVFTTYDQMNTVKGQTTDRRRLMDGIAHRAFIVLDESHNAGGTEASGWQKDFAPENRSDFLKRVLGKAKAVMFSSATYAKRPGVMALYARTDMGKAVESPDMLGELISKGGVPMQQVVAAMLAKAGQYIRRERSFDGVSYDVQPVAVDAGAYDAVSTSIATIARFDIEFKKSEVWDEIKEGLKDQAEAAAMDSGTGEISVSSTNFTSLMHNIVNQMLLAIKTDAVADLAIEALKNNEKPVITVSNTMGSFLKTFAEDHDIKRGDAVDLSFRDVLQRYLERTRRLTIKRPDGTKYHYTIPLSVLPGYMQKAYADAEQMIANLDTTNLPISPIDWLHYRLRKAGYRTAEITGRKETLEYGGPDDATFAERPDSEISPGGRRVNIDKYNRGALDVMILNRAGSTGLSLHASVKFKDQRRRRMIIAQAEGNIDVHMQMLGRVHRTGQVIPPAFAQAYADVPAEARPAAVLAKKMASLNANTTASRKSAFSADDSVDFLNEYGDQVAREYLRENPEIGEMLNVKVSDEAETARELTGRLLLLPVNEQRRTLDEISARYKALIDNLDAMGENALEAKTMDLEAKTLGRSELKASDGDSPFTQAVILEEVEVKSQGKALPLAEIMGKAAESLGIQNLDTSNPTSALNEIERTAGKVMMDGRYKTFLADFDRMAADEIKATKNEDIKTKRREAHAENRQRFTQITQFVVPGYRVVVRTKDGEPMTGIVMAVSRRGQTGATGNPLALGAWSAEIAIPDNAQRIIVPFSSVAMPQDNVPEGQRRIFLSAPDWAMGIAQTVDAFEKARQTGKEKRFIVTGNILAGFDATKGRGQIINYTDDKGNVKPGILMSRTFDQASFLNERAVRFKTAAQVMAFLKQLPAAEIVSHDNVITVRKADDFTEIELPSSRQTGGSYFLNPEVRRAARDQFTKVGSRMRYRARTEAEAQSVLDAMMGAGAVFQTTENQEAAEAIINGGKPRPQAPLSSRTQGRLSSVAPEPTFAAEFMTELAQTDELFRYPVVDSASLERILAGIVPEVESLGRFMLSEGDRQNGAFKKTRFRDADGYEFFVLEDRDGQVWLDISGYAPGQGGAAIYSALGNYAYNSGKVFIGDPAGLSDDALIRRTEAMLSSALKFGSTRHIEPHPRQLQGAPEIGIPPLKWTYGDDFGNIASLIEASTANTLNAVPELADAQFDFGSRTFRSGEGKPITDAEFRDRSYSSLGARKARAGSATLKRAVLLNSLLRAPGGERSGLLALVLRQSRELVRRGGLSGLLYSKPKPVFYSALLRAVEDMKQTTGGIPAERLNPYRFIVSEKQSAALKAEIQNIAKRVLGRNLRGIKIVDNQQVWNKLYGPNTDASYDPNTGIIWIALQGLQNPLSTIRHEAIHALRAAGVITEQEWKVLSRMARERWMDQYSINARYRRTYSERFDITPAQLEEILIEEAVADAMADHWRRPTGEDVIGRIMARVREFLEAVRNYLRSEGFTTASQILERIEQGQVGDRRRGSGQSRGFMLYAKQQSRGQDQTQTEAFKRWFGDWQDPKAFSSRRDPNKPAVSQVMKNGRPMVVYHGTKADITEFKSGLKGTNSGTFGWWETQRAGIFFAEDPSFAEEFATQGGDAKGANVLPVYLKITSPVDLTAGFDDAAIEAIEAAGLNPRDYANITAPAVWNTFDYDNGGRELVAALQAAGYDGAFMQEEGADGQTKNVWVAFDPTQIKSVNNRGTFDPRRQSILESRGRQQPTRAADDGGRGGFIAPPPTAEDEALREFAGNINLNYIDSPEAVKDVLRDAAEKADGFIKARRGVVSHDQTRQLAEESGMSLNKLLKRKRGEAWNAHDIYAARAMLIKSATIVKQAAARAANTTSDVDRAYFMRVMTRHAAIQEQIAGMTAEAGRALNQFKMLVGADYLRGVTEMLSEKRGNTGKIGPEAIEEMARMIDGLDGATQIGRMTRQMFRPRFFDMIREYYINSLLSGPTTQTVNFMSNVLIALNQIPESFVAEQIGKFRTGPKVERGETIARAFGLLQGASEGIALAWETLKTGEPQTPESQFDQPIQKAIPGVVGEVVRIPSRLMMTTDEFFKAVNYRAELNAIALRIASREGWTGRDLATRTADLVDNPSEAMVYKAAMAAKYQTFQNKLGPKGQALMRFREAVPVLVFVAPFLRTPINILKYAYERTPLAALPLIGMQETRDALSGKKGAVARDVQIARILLGTIFLTGMAAFVIAGGATGGGDDEWKKKAAARATGWQPYSIKVGDTYYSYLRFDPFSLHLGIVADMIEFKDRMKEGDWDQMGWAVMSSIVSNITDKTWLRGAVEFTTMLQDPKAYMSQYVTQLASGFVPNFGAQIARINDPYFRDAQSFMDKIKERVPGFRETLPHRIDVFGEKIKSEGNLGPDLFSPIWISNKKDNPVAQAMIDADYFPGPPRRHINGHDLTPEQYAAYSEMAGREAVRRLTKIVTAPNWAKRPQEVKEKIIKKHYDDAREFARNSLKRAYPDLRKPGED